ncbi:MAG: hypothetical protein HZB87_02900 [Desulfatitalea sp.]|nr:hypothetical protein [Desulfatitalea sp.]MBI5895337.1 hypothetical protein [Desulfobacterales bacterium]
MKEVVIVGGARTAIGNFNGALESFNPVDLGVIALKGALAKSGVAADRRTRLSWKGCKSGSVRYSSNG